MKADDRLSQHRNRRQRLAQLMGEGIAVVPTAPERVRNRDTHFPYRFDSHFYYLTGFPEPEAVLVLTAEGKSLLFCRERNEEREIWDGFRHGPEAARERFALDEAYPIGALDEKMLELLENQPALHYPVGADAEWDARAIRWLNAVRAKGRAGIAAPERVQDVRALIDNMRLVKDAQELGVMRRDVVLVNPAAAAMRRASIRREEILDQKRHPGKRPIARRILRDADGLIVQPVNDRVQLRVERLDARDGRSDELAR